jgi:hypothetical protein
MMTGVQHTLNDGLKFWGEFILIGERGESSAVGEAGERQPGELVGDGFGVRNKPNGKDMLKSIGDRWRGEFGCVVTKKQRQGMSGLDMFSSKVKSNGLTI